jgi:HD-like signal output (HDOD) protein
VSNSFVAGLVHDIGKIMFVHFLPDEYQKCITEFRTTGRSPSLVESEIIGANHCELGGLLAERWQLPEVLPAAIRGHHSLRTAAHVSDLEQALFWGNQVSKKLASFEPQMAAPDEVSPALTAWLGISLDEITEKLPEIKKEAERAEMLIRLA